MNLFQVASIASVFLYSFWFSDCCIEQVQKAYIKSVRCNVSDKFVYPNITCYAKSFNRSCSTATVIGTSKMPLNRIYLEGSAFFKYGVIYRPVITVPRFEWCSFTKQDNKNILINGIVNVFRNSGFGHIIHECPYQELNVKHVFIKLQPLIEIIFPTGDYKIVADVHVGVKQEHMATLTIMASWSSPNKDTFG